MGGSGSISVTWYSRVPPCGHIWPGCTGKTGTDHDHPRGGAWARAVRGTEWRQPTPEGLRDLAAIVRNHHLSLQAQLSFRDRERLDVPVVVVLEVEVETVVVLVFPPVAK